MIICFCISTDLEAGVTVRNLLHIFFDYYSAITMHQRNHLKNICNHIKALSTLVLASLHIHCTKQASRNEKNSGGAESLSKNIG